MGEISERLYGCGQELGKYLVLTQSGSLSSSTSTCGWRKKCLTVTACRVPCY